RGRSCWRLHRRRRPRRVRLPPRPSRGPAGSREGGPGGSSSPLSEAKWTSCGSPLGRRLLLRSVRRLEKRRSALLRAGDAEAGGRNGFEALRSNVLAAALALAVRAAIDAAE